jgi:hypothetical protein
MIPDDTFFHHRGPKDVGASPRRTAVEALARFVEAGRDLARAWDGLPRNETLGEGYPATLPAFATFCQQLAAWHDRQAARLPGDHAPDGPVFTLVVYSTPTRGSLPRPFGVRLIRKGDHWGRSGACLHTSDDPMVEVYDLEPVKAQVPPRWWDRDPDVIMARSYYVSSLMGRELLPTLRAAQDGHAQGVSLDTRVPEWTLDPAAMVQILRWLESLRDAGLIELRAGVFW